MFILIFVTRQVNNPPDFDAHCQCDTPTGPNIAKLRSCVKVEVAVLGSPSGLCGRNWRLSTHTEAGSQLITASRRRAIRLSWSTQWDVTWHNKDWSRLQ